MNDIRRFESIEDLSRTAAEFIVRQATDAVAARGLFSLVLSGGGTPRRTYELLAEGPHDKMIPWEFVHVFWGDERCVGPEHPDSNFRLAFDAFISKVPLLSANIHRVPAGLVPPQAGADAYEDAVKDFFRHVARGGEVDVSGYLPRFDLVLLGMGNDGHTASLFPGSDALEENSRLVVAVSAPEASPPVPRITLTYPAINHARTVLFLISGAEKEHILQEILEEPGRASKKYPAARIRPHGSLVWFVAP